ncbi:MAG TPA: SGNH/GDSL hydrolase family protein [Anaerolineaceae bacterium]
MGLALAPTTASPGETAMRTVLCYGDSNTWGYIPGTGGRYPAHVRWPGVLRGELGEGYTVLEEGLNGRTTVWEDPIEGFKNGKTYLIPCLETHRPLDLVVVMLGTNDLKKRFSLTAYDIADGAGTLVGIIQRSQCGPDGASPRVLLVAPPPLGKLTRLAEMFEDGTEKSRRLAEQYRRVAGEYGCDYLDTAGLVVSSDLDGIHLAAEAHQCLGRLAASRIKEIYRN